MLPDSIILRTVGLEIWIYKEKCFCLQEYQQSHWSLGDDCLLFFYKEDQGNVWQLVILLGTCWLFFVKSAGQWQVATLTWGRTLQGWGSGSHCQATQWSRKNSEMIVKWKMKNSVRQSCSHKSRCSSSFLLTIWGNFSSLLLLLTSFLWE